MAVRTATVLRAPVGEEAAQRHLLGLKEGHDLVIEQVRRRSRGLAVIELGKGDLAIGIDEGLLLDAPYTL